MKRYLFALFLFCACQKTAVQQQQNNELPVGVVVVPTDSVSVLIMNLTCTHTTIDSVAVGSIKYIMIKPLAANFYQHLNVPRQAVPARVIMYVTTNNNDPIEASASYKDNGWRYDKIYFRNTSLVPVADSAVFPSLATDSLSQLSIAVF